MLALSAPITGCASQKPTVIETAAIPPYPAFLSECPDKVEREMRQCIADADTDREADACQIAGHKKLERCLISSEGTYREVRRANTN